MPLIGVIDDINNINDISDDINDKKAIVIT